MKRNGSAEQRTTKNCIPLPAPPSHMCRKTQSRLGKPGSPQTPVCGQVIPGRHRGRDPRRQAAVHSLHHANVAWTPSRTTPARRPAHLRLLLRRPRRRHSRSQHHECLSRSKQRLRASRSQPLQKKSRFRLRRIQQNLRTIELQPAAFSLLNRYKKWKFPAVSMQGQIFQDIDSYRKWKQKANAQNRPSGSAYRTQSRRFNTKNSTFYFPPLYCTTSK